jgi:hypothetical protein
VTATADRLADRLPKAETRTAFLLLAVVLARAMVALLKPVDPAKDPKTEILRPSETITTCDTDSVAAV